MCGCDDYKNEKLKPGTGFPNENTMPFLLKHSQSGHFVIGMDDEDFAQFSGNYNNAWWWETEEDANWFIEQKGLANVTAFSVGGTNPPGPGQPGKP